MRYTDAIYYRLRELCEIKRVSMEEVCIKSGAQPSFIRKLEKGRIIDISIRMVFRMCGALGVLPREFFDSDLFKLI